MSLHSSVSIFLSPIFQVQDLMDRTFCCQRYAINSQLPVSDVLEEWPYLGIKSTLLQHYKDLTDVDIESLLLAAVDNKASTIYEFCKGTRSKSGVTEVLCDIDAEMNASGSNAAIRDGFILLILTSVREEISNMIIIMVLK